MMLSLSITVMHILLIWPLSSSTIVSPIHRNSSSEHYIASLSITKYFHNTIICNSTNCNILCDEITSCFNTTIDAIQSQVLQIECTGKESCYHTKLIQGPTESISITCSNDSSCLVASFNFSTTKTADIKCINHNENNDDEACSNTRFYGIYSSNVSVYCAASNCYGTQFYVNASEIVELSMNGSWASQRVQVFGEDIAKSLTLQCLDTFSCGITDIYCPDNADCNIECHSSSGCGVHLYIENQYYSHLNISFISQQWPSDETSIRCKDAADPTETYSRVYWFEEKQRYQCYEYDCCPVSFQGKQMISCDAYSDCVIECNEQQSCANKVIDGSNAVSLTVKCATNTSCIDVDIECPNWSYDDLTCHIICDAPHSCEDMFITVPHDMTRFTVLCNDDKACLKQQIWNRNFATTKIGNASLYCTDNESCLNARWGFHNVDVMEVQCSGYKSCQNVEFAQHLFTISVTSFQLKCEAPLSCNSISARLQYDLKAWYHTDSFNIVCNNGCRADNEAIGACYEGKFYVTLPSESYAVSPARGYLNIDCSALDCENATFSFGSHYDYSTIGVNLNCIGELSCLNALLVGSRVSVVNIKCEKDSACYHTKVLCPYTSDNACHIMCDTSDNVCYGMTIYSNSDKSNYNDNYLHLNCSPPSCSELKFVCSGYYVIEYDFSVSNYKKKTSYLKADESNTIYDGCNKVACCPVGDHIETAAPTEEPISSVSPTTYPLSTTSSTAETVSPIATAKSLSPTTKVSPTVFLEATTSPTVSTISTASIGSTISSASPTKKSSNINVICIVIVVGLVVALSMIAFGFYFKKKRTEKDISLLSDHVEDSYQPPTTDSDKTEMIPTKR